MGGLLYEVTTTSITGEWTAKPDSEFKKQWMNSSILCKNNEGYEKHFERGITYLCLKEDGDDIWVIDMNGVGIKVKKTMFEIV